MMASKLFMRNINLGANQPAKRMITDTLSRFSRQNLALFDKAEREGLDDNDICKKSEDLFLIYFVEMLLSWGDGFLEMAKRSNRA